MNLLLFKDPVSLHLTPAQYDTLRRRLDSSFYPSKHDGVIEEFLRDTGLDPDNFRYRETRIIVDFQWPSPKSRIEERD